MVQTAYTFFDFNPSQTLAIVGLCVFLAAATLVLIQTLRVRTWFMLIPTAVGIMEAGGYACRIAMLHKPLRGIYITMQCLLIIPPSFLALCDYIVLGRIVAMIQDYQSTDHSKIKLRPKWLTWIFFACEIGSLACQGAGAGLSVGSNNDPGTSNSNSTSTLGRILLIVGLAALVILIIFYTCTAIYVNSSVAFRVPGVPALRILFFGIYCTVTLLLVRNIFRLVEFSQGWEGYIADHEVYFYCLDALLMAIWIFLMVPLHFGVFLRRLERELIRDPKYGQPNGGRAPQQIYPNRDRGVEMA